jgi:hypothetical protein
VSITVKEAMTMANSKTTLELMLQKKEALLAGIRGKRAALEAGFPVWPRKLADGVAT